MINSHEIAWAAGLFDGEGCIRIERYPTGRYLLRLQIKMTHLPTIDRLVKLFSPVMPYPEKGRRGNHKDAYQLKWNGKKGERVLRTIFPYLFTKAEDANIAFQFLNAPKGSAGDKVREACYLSLRKGQGKLGETGKSTDGAVPSVLTAPNEAV